jgi:hypothetical protein
MRSWPSIDGNAGASTAHYLEGYSITYWLVLTNLASGAHNVRIEWDTKQNDREALDYITHFDRINNPSHVAAFGHSKEITDPTIGISGLGAPSTVPIPAPSSAGSPVPGQPTNSFNALPAGERLMTIYSGTITSLSYVFEDNLSAKDTSSRLSINFTTTNATVILVWGGHIASRLDWGFFPNGQPRSAAGINGSSYHTRLIELDGTGGNQDRSLSADAVIVLCGACSVSGSDSVCPQFNQHLYVNDRWGL